MAIKFRSFSSGSCGNCYFLGSFDDAGECVAAIVIDAGVSPRRTKRYLQEQGLCFDNLDCMIITHDHHDHIGSLGSWCKLVGIPVWATPELNRAMSHRYEIKGPCYPSCRKNLSEDWNDIVPGHVRVRYFVVPHDATQTLGYAVLIDGYRFVIMTDIGKMTPQALSFAKQAQTVVIESNYDTDMLWSGPYPEELKVRITSGSGHLSNAECAEAVREFMHEGLDNIFLCHLSDHNNTARLALEPTRAVLDSLDPAPQRVPRVVPLPREVPSPLFTL